jgi:hypothetical protein
MTKDQCFALSYSLDKLKQWSTNQDNKNKWWPWTTQTKCLAQKENKLGICFIH